MKPHLLLPILLLVGSATAPSTLGKADDQLRIAVMAPFTGPVAIYGNQIVSGFRQAVDDLNAGGGVLGKKIESVLYDDRCDPPQAMQIAQRIIALKETPFIIGPACSTSALATVPRFAAARDSVIDVLSFSATPALTEQGFANIFRVVPRADRQGRIASEYLQKIKANYNIAILNDGTPYATGIISALQQAWPTLDIDTKFQGRYSPGETDFAPLIAQLHANDAKVVYVAGISNGLGKLLVAARSQNYRPLFVASEQAWSQDLWTIAGESADGVLFTFFPDPARNAQTAPVVARMRQQRREPSVPGLYTYAAVQVLTQAAAIAGSIDVPKITGALHEGRFNTVIGPVAFDAKGDIKDLSYEFYRWQKGTSMQVNDRPPPPPPPPPQ